MNFVNSSKKIQSKISVFLESNNITAAAQAYDQLEEIYNVLYKVLSEIKLIKLGCRTSLISKIKKLREEIEILEQPSTSLEDIQKLQLKDKGVMEVAPGINLRTLIVPSEEFIPDSPLYYIRLTDEYAIKINGTLIKGKIRDFSKSTKNIMCICNKKDCKWGHDAHHTWSTGSWIHTTEPLMKKNQHMRHIGSRSTLLGDIKISTRMEKEIRMRQVAHDLLIQLCIDKVDTKLN
jgi:hypothetical protein